MCKTVLKGFGATGLLELQTYVNHLTSRTGRVSALRGLLASDYIWLGFWLTGGRASATTGPTGFGYILLGTGWKNFGTTGLSASNKLITGTKFQGCAHCEQSQTLYKTWRWQQGASGPDSETTTSGRSQLWLWGWRLYKLDFTRWSSVLGLTALKVAQKVNDYLTLLGVTPALILEWKVSWF